MIIHYTKHAEEKFFILQNHGRQILKEDINDILKFPEKSEEKKAFHKVCGYSKPGDEKWEIVFKKEDAIYRILTFYPVKV